MATRLEQFRRQNPAYDDMTDGDLARALHRRFYADMPQGDFFREVGYEPRRTAGGWVRAAGQAFGQGAVSSIGSSIEGSGLIPEQLGAADTGSFIADVGRDVMQVGRDIGPDDEYRGFVTDVFSGLGAMATYLGPGLLATGFLRGAGAVGRAAGQLAAVAPMAGAAGASEAYNRAISAGESHEDALDRAMEGIPAGVVQVAPVAVLLRRLPPGIQGRAVGQIRAIAEAFGAEFLAEGAGAVWQNLIEQAYNEERGTWDDTVYQGIIGGTSAALLSAGIQVATRGRGVYPGGRSPDTADQQDVPGRRDDADDMPAGLREAASAATPAPSEADIRSPIDTEVVQAGREAMAQQDAANDANIILREHGYPTVDSEVLVTPPGQQGITGTITDVFVDPDLGPGMRVSFPDGSVYAAPFAEIEAQNVAIESIAAVEQTRQREQQRVPVAEPVQVSEPDTAIPADAATPMARTGVVDAAPDTGEIQFETQGDPVQAGQPFETDDGRRFVVTEIPENQFERVRGFDVTDPANPRPQEWQNHRWFEFAAKRPIGMPARAPDPDPTAPLEPAPTVIPEAEGVVDRRMEAETERPDAPDVPETSDQIAADADAVGDADVARAQVAGAEGALQDATQAVLGDADARLEAVADRLNRLREATRSEPLPPPPPSPLEGVVDATPAEVAQQAEGAPAAPGEAQGGIADGVAPRAPIETRDIGPDVAVTPSGREVPVRYAIVEAGSLVASHRESGEINPDYPAAFQPRDRGRAVSQQQITEMSGRLDPRLLDRSPKASDGAPIVAPDGVVESGNARTLAIRSAYERGLPSAQQYREFLAERGYPVEGVNQPVLVRVREGDMTPQERAAFTREANERDTLGMSASERAMADAAAMSPDMLALYRGGDVDMAQNRPFVRAFMEGIVGPTERAGMVAADGSLSQDAMRRVQGAMLARAYGDANLVANLTESADTNIKAIGGALLDVAPEWAQMRAQAEQNAIAPEMDQTAALLEAVNLVQRARREGRNVAEYVSQTDMLAGRSMTDTGEAFLGLMFRDVQRWTRPTGRDRLATALRFYVEEANRTSPGVDLLGDTAPEPGRIIDLARDRQYAGPAEQADLLAQPAGRAGDGTRAAGVAGEREGRPGPGAVAPEGAVASGEGAQGAAAADVAPAADTAADQTEAPDTIPPEATRAETTRFAMMDREEATGAEREFAITTTSAFDTAIQRGELRDAFRAELNRLGLGRVSVDVVDRIQAGQSEAAGAFNPDVATIYVSMQSPDMVQTLNHEVLHVLRASNLFRDSEWRALERAARSDTTRMESVRNDYAEQGLSEEALIEEVVAFQYAEWIAGQREATGMIRAAFRRISRFFEALGNALRGLGFQSADDIFQSVSEGEIGRRASPEGVAEFMAPLIEANSPGVTDAQALEMATRDIRLQLRPSRPASDGARPAPLPVADRMGWVSRIFNTPRHLADRFPAFRRVYTSVVNRWNTSNRVRSNLAEMAEGYWALNDADRTAANEALVRGDREQRIYETAEEAGLSEAQFEGYQAIRAMFDGSLDIMASEIRRTFGVEDGVDSAQARDIADIVDQPGRPDDMAIPGLVGPPTRNGDAFRVLADRLQEIEAARLRGYIPHVWKGTHRIVVRDRATGETVYMEGVEAAWGVRGRMARSLGARLNAARVRARQAELEAQYPDSTVMVVEASEQAGMLGAEIDLGVLDHLASITSVDQALYDQVMEPIREEVKARTWRRHLFHRKNIQGYETQDVAAVIAGYVHGLSNTIGSMRYGRDINEAVEGIDERRDPNLKRYARAYAEYSQSPQEEFQQLRFLTFAYYLGANVSSAFVNMSQVPVLTFPTLVQFTSTAKATAEIGRAYADAARAVTWRGGEGITVDFAKIPADVRAAVKRAYDDGLIGSMVALEQMGLASGERRFIEHLFGQGLSRKFRRVGGKTADAMIGVYSAAEQLNRVVTLIAAMRSATPEARQKANEVYRERGLFASEVGNAMLNPEAFARFVMIETQFMAGKVNRPAFMRGPGAPIFQFMTFVVNSLETLSRMVRRQGPEGRKGLAAYAVVMISFAGTLGLPFGDDIKKAIEAIYRWASEEDLDLEQAAYDLAEDLDLPPSVAEAILRGPLRAFSGIDVSRRVGMGAILPDPTDPREIGGMPAEMFLGRGSRFVENIRQERHLEAAGELLPLAVRSPLQAAAWASGGVRTGRGDVIVPPGELDAGDIAARAIGFQPSPVTRARETEWAVSRAATSGQQYRARIYQRVAVAQAEIMRARETGDESAALRALQRIERIRAEVERHNARAAPAEVINLGSSSARTAIRRRVARELYGAEARRIRGQARERADEIRGSRP